MPFRTIFSSRPSRSVARAPHAVSGPNDGSLVARAADLIAANAATAAVIICCGVPLVWLAVALAENAGAIAGVGVGSFEVKLLGRTLLYNTSAALIAVLMGIPAGLVLGRGRGWVARSLWLILPAALFVPSLALAYGWSQAVRLGQPVLRPMGLTFFPGSASDIFRCVWTLASWLWAIPACVIGLSLRRMDAGVQQQALLDGALWRVTLRQLAGPIVASGALVMILASQEFAVYEPTGISVVATEVRMVFDSGAFSSLTNPISAPLTGEGARGPDQAARSAAAAVTALPLLAITAGLALLAAVTVGRVEAGDALTVGDWPTALDAPGWLVGVALVLLMLNLAVPVGSLWFALRVPFAPVKIFTEFSPLVGGSYIVGSITAGVALVAAASMAARRRVGLLAAAAVAFLIGGQLLAIGMIRAVNRPGLFWAYDAWPLPVAAYFARFGWIALAAGRGTHGPAWREVRQMAALDGASRLGTAWSVVIPLAWPMLLAGALLVGALSLTEVPATVLLAPQHPQVLTPLLMTWVHMARFDSMIEACLLMLAMMLIPVTAAAVLVRGFSRRRPQTMRAG